MDSRQQIRIFIADTFFAEGYSDQESFLRAGIIDSTGMMELVAFLEQRFGVKIEDAELVPANLDSVENLCRFIERKAPARAAG